jgi:hypothetical protein
VTGSAIGNNILETYTYVALDPLSVGTLEQSQDRFWHYLYFNATGENVQVRIYTSAAQNLSTQIAFSDFQLNAFQFIGKPVAQLGYNSTL